jgi:hypothetical protein
MTTSNPASGLTIRQFDRRRIDVPVEFVICDAHRAQVRLSGTSAATDRHVIPMRSLDLSRGGMGLASRVLVPRMCAGRLRIFKQDDGADLTHRPALVEVDVAVRRVTMTGPEPSYFVGVSFVSTSVDLEATLAAILTAAEGEATHA